MIGGGHYQREREKTEPVRAGFLGRGLLLLMGRMVSLGPLYVFSFSFLLFSFSVSLFSLYLFQIWSKLLQINL
jgi:hypothetical protein